ncbi:unnamed protein product [Vicia faba]|uniref:S-protein homolog n=1 Tax=Vicia faba TaxID=3906 RepID=A0AAV0ZWK9_VICFA|nr:unnamed protein product [Vicia faba]
MSPLIKKLLLLLCLLTLISINNVEGKIHVKIANLLQDKSNLTVHCKSKDDDVGSNLLQYSDSYNFQFNENIFGSTLFFCSFEWKDQFQWFDIYISTRDSGVEKQKPVETWKEKSQSCNQVREIGGATKELSTVPKALDIEVVDTDESSETDFLDATQVDEIVEETQVWSFC